MPPARRLAEAGIPRRRRRRLRPPAGLVDPVSRAEAAELLGYPSVFRVRELEREGRLTATRGVMGSAWYPRRQILTLRDQEGRPPQPAPESRPPPRGRCTDAELIAYLRAPRPGSSSGLPGRPPTLADLVADTGVSIVRAQRIYRFWLAHDAHPAAEVARLGGRSCAASSPVTEGPAGPVPGSERRSPARLTRAALIRQLRAADPRLRAAAFSALKNSRPPADIP